MLEVGKVYLTKGGDTVLITGWDPKRIFNKFFGYKVMPNGDTNTYTSLSMLMSWGTQGGYWWSGQRSKHDIRELRGPHSQPTVPVAQIEIK